VRQFVGTLDISNRDTVTGCLHEVRQRLIDGEHNDAASRAAEALQLPEQGHDAALRFARELPADHPGPETEPEGEGPFLSRHPLVSVVQAEVDAEQHRGLIARAWQGIKRFFRRLVKKQLPFAADLAEGFLKRLSEGTFPFNPEPAEHEIEDRARLIVVGDWGSGTDQAKSVAKLMRKEVRNGREEGRQIHVIHLGDVYFAGEADEYRRKVLGRDCWPVTRWQAMRGVRSWSLAGNHDMYGSAKPFFTVLLGDLRFRLQRAVAPPETSRRGLLSRLMFWRRWRPFGGRRSTSWFRLSSPSWDIIGLDSSWNDCPFERGQKGLLEDPQAQRVARWVDDNPTKKRLVLSHHQLVTVYDSRLKSMLDAGDQPELYKKLQDVIDDGGITAWMWGHEHRCMAFKDPAVNIPFLRCLGHGGQLQRRRSPGPAPPTVLWEETATFMLDGSDWGRCGFAVLDLEGPTINVRYHLDDGVPVCVTEQFN
jgi:hypothetical protein